MELFGLRFLQGRLKLNESDRIVFDLFILQFWFNDWDKQYIDEKMYEAYLDCSFFKMISNCFPENEHCYQTVTYADDAYKIAINLKHNFIKED